MHTAIDLRREARSASPVLPAAALDPSLIEHARATWRGRMVNEHGSARVFRALAAQLREAGLDGAERCDGFAEEERTHGVLCGAVLEALGGEARFEEAPCHYPLHRDATPREAVVRNVLSIGCLSETVAVALVGAERLAMPEGELRELLTSILADEVGHARFGWGLVSQHVPSMDAGAKARLGAYLRVALGHLEQHELAHLPLSACPPPEGAALGLCSGGEARQLFFDTVEGVIVPRLTALGLPAEEAWRRRVVNGLGAQGTRASIGDRRSAPGVRVTRGRQQAHIGCSPGGDAQVDGSEENVTSGTDFTAV